MTELRTHKKLKEVEWNKFGLHDVHVVDSPNSSDMSHEDFERGGHTALEGNELFADEEVSLIHN